MPTIRYVALRDNRISITNLAERHLRLGECVGLRVGEIACISITNLAERHLRLAVDLRVAVDPRVADINHESSRKAFETRGVPRGLDGERQQISITNLAERQLRPGKPELFQSSGRPSGYQSRI